MYKISEVSELTKLPISTLSYYERKGLIVPKRNEVNYRYFDDGDLVWLRFIENMKKCGMTIEEIKHFSDLKAKGEKSRDERLNLLELQRGFLTAKLSEINESLLFIDEAEKITKQC